MTRMESDGCGNISGNAVVRVSAAVQGGLTSNMSPRVLGASLALDRWRRALGEGSMGNSVARRTPIRTRAAQQIVLDEFAVIAKKCRKRRHLSIEMVAHHSGIPVKRIQQFERGAVAASEPEIMRLSAVYGVEASVITRRLKREFDQFAGDDVHAIQNILHVKWTRARKDAANHMPARGASAASERHDARTGADHKPTNTGWPAFPTASVGESILAESIELLTLTACIQAVVANGGTLLSIQGEEHSPRPARAGSQMKAIRIVGRDDLLALVHGHLEGIIDRLEALMLRRPAFIEPAAEFTHSHEIGDVIPFPEREIHAERARIADAMKLIAPSRTQPPLPTGEVHGGTHVPTDTPESPCTRNGSRAQPCESTLSCAVDLLSEAAYNLFELSGHCA